MKSKLVLSSIVITLCSIFMFIGGVNAEDSPNIISTINFTYDEAAMPFSSSISLKDMSTWVQQNVGSDTENIKVYNDSNSNLVSKSGTYYYSVTSSDNPLGTEEEYGIMFGASTTSKEYSFLSNVTSLSWSSQIPVTELDGLTIKVNGEVRTDALISYSESWKCIMVYVPLGKAPLSHRITFNTNGGSNVNEQNVLHMDYVEEPENPTRDGFVFDGWYTDSSFTDRFYFNTEITDDTTLYAKWNEVVKEVSATVRAPKAGQTPDMNIVVKDSNKYEVSSLYWYLFESPYPHLSSSDAFENGKNYSLRVAFNAKEGYALTYDTVFKINGVATSCYGAAENRELTFYIYTVKFNTNGGSEVPSQSLYTSSKIDKPNNPTKKGYAFKGWYSDSELTEEYSFDTPITGNKTLYAKWAELIDLSSAKVSGIAAKIYTGKGIKQNLKVVFNNNELKEKTNYKVEYKNNINAGTATIIITGQGDYTGTITRKFIINKANNPMTVTVKNKKIKYKKVKKKKQIVTSLNVTKAQGKVTYAKVSGNKRFKINKTTGKITVKKKTKKGTYKIKVKVTSQGNNNYKGVSKIVTIKIKIK